MKICRDWLGSHGLAYFVVSDGLEMKKIPFSGVLATWWNYVQAIVVRAIMNTKGQVSTTWWHTEKTAQQDGNYVPSTSPIAPWTQVCVSHLGPVQLFMTPWTVAHQAPLSMGFPRQEYLRGLPFPPTGVLPNPDIKLQSLVFQADSLPSESPGKPFIYLFF